MLLVKTEIIYDGPKWVGLILTTNTSGPVLKSRFTFNPLKIAKAMSIIRTIV